MNYSTTVAGAIVMLLSFLAESLNIKLPYTNEQIKDAIITIVGVIGFLITIYGRYRHGDINLFGFKKQAPVEIDSLPDDQIRP